MCCFRWRVQWKPFAEKNCLNRILYYYIFINGVIKTTTIPISDWESFLRDLGRFHARDNTTQSGQSRGMEEWLFVQTENRLFTLRHISDFSQNMLEKGVHRSNWSFFFYLKTKRIYFINLRRFSCQYTIEHVFFFFPYGKSTFKNEIQAGNTYIHTY